MLNFEDISVLSFDCYGTLIDWEKGILSALEPLLSRSQSRPSETDVLRLYGQYEREAESQTPFVNYRSVLKQVVQSLSVHLNLNLRPQEENILAESMGNWPPFPDTVPALEILKSRFKLGIISNVDADLFRHSEALLKVHLDWVVTSEQMKSYKPAQHNFRYAMSTFGLDPRQYVHVAQSLHHDVAPANALGLKTVWVNRTGAASTRLSTASLTSKYPTLKPWRGW